MKPSPSAPGPPTSPLTDIEETQQVEGLVNALKRILKQLVEQDQQSLAQKENDNDRITPPPIP